MFNIAYETDRVGNVIRGSHKNLLQRAKQVSDIKLGLEVKRTAKTYEEIIPFMSVALTEDYIIGIQPYHKSSKDFHAFTNAEKSSFVPYSTVFFYSSERHHGTFRYNIDGSFRPSSLPIQNRYNYYRWFVSDDLWQIAYDSVKDDKEEREKLISILKKQSPDLKLSFDYKGITYIVAPNIIYFPKADKDIYSISDLNLSVKTYPILLLEGNSPITSWKKFEVAELLINISGYISILSYRQFDLSLSRTFFKRIMRQFHFRTRPERGINLKHCEINTSVKWHIKTKAR